jgi:hypothetical protein
VSSKISEGAAGCTWELGPDSCRATISGVFPYPVRTGMNLVCGDEYECPVHRPDPGEPVFDAAMANGKWRRQVQTSRSRHRLRPGRETGSRIRPEGFG